MVQSWLCHTPQIHSCFSLFLGKGQAGNFPDEILRGVQQSCSDRLNEAQMLCIRHPGLVQHHRASGAMQHVRDGA